MWGSSQALDLLESVALLARGHPDVVRLLLSVVHADAITQLAAGLHPSGVHDSRGCVSLRGPIMRGLGLERGTAD